jgi:putative ABC transport system substrate-binding protein
MRRREFIALMGASIAWPFAAMAQQAGRTYRLGCLLPATLDVPVNAAFFEELRRRGFIEGQNLTVEYHAYGQHVDLIWQYAAELVKARVDVIVVAGGVWAFAPHSKRRKQFRSSHLQRICSGLD